MVSSYLSFLCFLKSSDSSTIYFLHSLQQKTVLENTIFLSVLLLPSFPSLLLVFSTLSSLVSVVCTLIESVSGTIRII
nr:hypothetical protein Itr_chr06CG12870 [Ipomoea trifida]GMD03730.1 hypothetical protein Iba_chr06aCG11670 [Ipomoea batatas]